HTYLPWCAFQPTDLIQPSAPPQGTTFISADEGDEITLRCGHKDKATRYYWYKQSHGQRPRLISSFYKFEQNGTFHNEFQQEPRFTLETESQKNNLKITNLQLHDSAVYLCASNYAYFFEFDRSTTVNVKGSGLNVQALVHQSGSGTVQPQGSVTLNCTIHTGSCDGEHTVYWFKSSQASQPGLIYTGGGRTKHCERSENTQTQMCVYNFPLHNLTQSHAGTYYCAVVSCGHIVFGNVFGNGTKLDLRQEYPSSKGQYLLLTSISLPFLHSLLCYICLQMRWILLFSYDGQNKDSLCHSAARKKKMRRSSGQTPGVNVCIKRRQKRSFCLHTC
uniref:Ig-like domain-containing protein n=1 Tax=Salarias fasciatus TaxID=181472 RepID=A0A672GB71_SALFA